jgi:thioredoxin-related protein
MKAMSFFMPFVLFISANWLIDFDQAKQQAKERNQLILLNFSGSDWCAPCIKMKKEIFETEQFKDFADNNLVLVRADFPRQKKNQLDTNQKQHNEKLAEQFNPNGKFPFTLLLDANGKVIYQWDGYYNMTTEAFINDIRAKAYGK